MTAYAYISNTGSDNVSVIDTSTNTITATISVGTSPRVLAMTRDGTQVWVPNYSSQNVSVIDTSTNTVIATITLPVIPFVNAYPTAVALTPDGSQAWVSSVSSNVSARCYVIDTATYTVVSSLGYDDGGEFIAITPNGSRVYLPFGFESKVWAIKPSAGIDEIHVGTTPYGVAFSPDSSTAYVANVDAGTLSVIDVATHTVVATPDFSVGISALVLTPDGSQAYMTNQETNNVLVVDMSTYTVTATIAVGTEPFLGIGITPDGSQVYAANQASDNVSVIDTSTNTVIATITAGSGPYGVTAQPTAAFLPSFALISDWFGA